MTRLFALALVGVLAACAEGGESDDFDATPWVTTVDSTGDTTIVRITGDVPPTHVRSLVAELRVGAEEGDETVTFGDVGTVLGTPGGGLLVHDAQAVAIRLFDSTGAFVRSIGRKGGGPGEYDHLNGLVALADDRLLLWDASGARLNLYTADGDFLETVRMPVTGTYGYGMLFADTAGSVFASAVVFRDSSDRTKNRRGFIRMSLTGAVHDSTDFIAWREAPPTLRAQSKDGGASITYGLPFSPATSNRISPYGPIISGPGDPYVFYILPRSGGRPRKIVREHVPVPVSPTEASERRQQVEEAMRGVDPIWSWTGPAVPATKPAYRSFEIGRDGRIWVLLSQPAEPIPPSEQEPVRSGAPPTVRIATREPAVYDVFTPDGALLGRVALPPRTVLSTMRGPYVWGVQRDSLDVEYAVRFRIQPALPSPD